MAPLPELQVRVHVDGSILPKHLGVQAEGRVDTERVEWLTRELLLAVGQDPTEDRIKDTPARVARWWKEFMDYDPGTISTAFQSVRADQLVVLSGVRVWSLCEHHLLPFNADVTVAYLPTDKVLGLSKLARIINLHAHKPQIQERFVHEIAETIKALTGSPDVAVLATGEHLCMTMRGVKTPGKMTSSVLEGAFRTESALRAEFMALAHPKQP